MTIFEDITYKDKIADMFKFGWEYIDAPLFSSLFVMLVVMILATIIGIKAKKAIKNEDYKRAPKGILFWADAYFSYLSKFVTNNMGSGASIYTGYFFTLFAYLFLAFNASLLGIPSVMDWLWAPLCLALVMFSLIQVVALKYQHWGYFHRYIEPIPVFLPINLVTMWSPIISTTMRMFGNCLAGSVIVGLLQWATSGLSNTIMNAMGASSIIPGISAEWYSWWNSSPYWTGIWLSPIPMGILNSYFSLFSGFIQTLVFASLTALWVAQERPNDEATLFVEFPQNSFAIKQRDKNPKQQEVKV